MKKKSFNKKLGIELYKKASYLKDKPKTKLALIKVARAIYRNYDATKAIRTYFEPGQRKQAADVVSLVSRRVKHANFMTDTYKKSTDVYRNPTDAYRNSDGELLSGANLKASRSGDAGSGIKNKDVSRNQYVRSNSAVDAPNGIISHKSNSGGSGIKNKDVSRNQYVRSHNAVDAPNGIISHKPQLYLDSSGNPLAGTNSALQQKEYADKVQKDLADKYYTSRRDEEPLSNRLRHAGSGLLNKTRDVFGATGNWIKDHPLGTVGIGAGGLGLAGLLYYLNQRRKRNRERELA